MKSTNLYRIVLLAVTAIYCIVLFWVGAGNYTPNLWVVFIFTIISPIAGLAATFMKPSTERTKIASAIKLGRAVIIHFVGQLLLHLFLLIESFPTAVLVIIEVLFTLALVIYVAYSKAETAVIEERVQDQKKKVRYLATLEVTLRGAYDSATDEDVKKALNKLLEKVQYSPFQSIPEVEQTESEMLILANQLEDLSPEEQLKSISRLDSLLNRRNNLVSMIG